MVQSTPKIDLLPEHLIDQIKAGEVIERPGNLIKEILENAIDAGSTKIELSLRNNGLEQISLKDNGHGMRYDDLPLAFARHATSKIKNFEDLYRLHSFGFRGEALASIAAISKLQCISITSEDEFASELRIEGGHTIFHEQRKTASFKQGTELVIKDLFYNTPARLKFIQSQQVEKTFIKKIIYAFIVSHPEVEFHIKFDDLDKEIYQIKSDYEGRIKDLIPKAADALLSNHRFYESSEAHVFLVPGSYRSPTKFQHIFINHRFILDKQLHRIISNSLQSLYQSDEFHYIIFLNLPSDSIDVNVHPNKTIIKVLETSKMISLLTSTIKEMSSKTQSQFQSHPQNEHKIEKHPSLLDQISSPVELHQERHQYNMDGIFSPHQVTKSSQNDFIWMGKYFIKKVQESWVAVSATKLLEHYTRSMLKTNSATIPLLVSEPFHSKGVKDSSVYNLTQSGLELEHLGPETIVLRGIPEWMNGFPLKSITQALLLETSFEEIEILPEDWSQSTWNGMLDYFDLKDLIEKKVLIDLGTVLREKLK